MITLPQKFVHAQEPVCLDAAGGVIPCPPASDSSEGSEDSDEGNARPTATPVPPTSTAIPTATPLPISAAPTATPKEGYLGQCTPEDDFLTCKEKFVCEDGLFVIEIDLYTEGGTTYDFYCIPNENIPQLNFPIAIPTNDGPVENWVVIAAAVMVEQISTPALTLIQLIALQRAEKYPFGLTRVVKEQEFIVRTNLRQARQRLKQLHSHSQMMIPLQLALKM
ncbi:MAG: hypothetical protein IPP55_02075 [Anaerolineales bacterium]|nr:hypothetical protein [Anaerolineales bacterium]